MGCRFLRRSAGPPKGVAGEEREAAGEEREEAEVALVSGTAWESSVWVMEEVEKVEEEAVGAVEKEAVEQKASQMAPADTRSLSSLDSRFLLHMHIKTLWSSSSGP